MIPNAYYKTIYDIDYDNLLKKGYINIFLDVDNTLIPYTEDKVRKENIDLINRLKSKGFNVIVVSNSRSKRVLKIVEELGIRGYYSSMKPLKKTYKKILKEFNKNECIFIGDQFMTDVLGAYRCGIKIILVDRISDAEPIYTRFWRFFEKRLLNIYKKQDRFKIHEYYDNIN